MTTLDPGRRVVLHSRALHLEYFTIGCNVIEAFVAIGAGLLAGSVALVGFGVDSGVEVISAVGSCGGCEPPGPTPKSARNQRPRNVPSTSSPSRSSYLRPTSPSTPSAP